MRAPYLNDGDVRLYHGDVLDVLREMDAESVQTCVTSPPYWGLRDYGTATWEGGDPKCDHKGQPLASSASTLTGNRGTGVTDTDKLATNGVPYRETCGKCGARRVDAQLGLEPTPAEYVARMVEVFREVRRVLRDDGTLWLNLGDSYAASGGAHGGRDDNQRGVGAARTHEAGAGDQDVRKPPSGLKPKDLVGIPWRVALALQEDGWWLRSDIIWAKPNPMPESITDRPTKAHEYIFLLTKSARYFYDAEAVKETAVATWNAAEAYSARQSMTAPEIGKGADLKMQRTRGFGTHHEDRDRQDRNARSVWTITTKPYSGAHFATFPPELPSRCIKAATPEAGCCAECGAPRERVIVATSPDGRSAEMRGGKAYDAEGRPLMGDNMIDHGTRGSWNSGGATLRRETMGFRASCHCDADTVPAVVLDPFSGSGTTAFVARQLARRAVGIDLNTEYLDLAADRLKQLSLFGGAA